MIIDPRIIDSLDEEVDVEHFLAIDQAIADAEGWFTEDEMHAIDQNNLLSAHSYSSSE